MVSIIVPVYNVKDYLAACVASLRGQSWRDVEIILVDDGSSDGSGALCDGFAAEDGCIRVVHKENGGLSSARNAGLDAARGEWVLFVDGDDYLAPHGLQQLMELAADHPDADFIQFRYQETDGTWRGEEAMDAQVQVCTTPREFFQRLYELGGVAASACTKLWAKRIFDEVRFAEGLLHEDEELLTCVLPRCGKAVYTDLVLYGYVMRPGSIVHTGFRPRSMDVFRVLDGRIRTLEELGLSELARRTKERQFQSAAWLYCKARRAGFPEEAGALKGRILELAKEPGLELSGQYRVLRQAARWCPAAPEIYYGIRRICGKS